MSREKVSVLGIPAIVGAFQMQQSDKISTPTQEDTKVRQIFSLEASAEVFQPHTCSTEPPQESAYTLSWTRQEYFVHYLCVFLEKPLVWKRSTTTAKEVHICYNSVVRMLKHLTLFLKERP